MILTSKKSYGKYKHILIFILLIINISTVFPQVKSVPQNIKSQIESNDQLAKKYKDEGNLSEATRYLNQSAYLLQINNAPDLAIEYYLKVLDINEKLDNQKGTQLTCNNLGMLYIDKEDYDDALTYLQKSLQLSRQFKEKTDIASGLTNIATAQQGLNRHKDAVTSLEEAIKLAKELNNLKLLRRCCGLIYESYDKLGNSQKSYEYFDLYSSLDKEIKKQEMANVQADAKTEVNKANSEKQLTEEELRIRNTQLKKTKDSLQAAEVLTHAQKIEIELNKSQLEIERMKRLQLTIGLAFLLLFTAILALLLYQNIKAKRKINEQKESSGKTK